MQTIVIFSGAGLSACSGLPTFRGSGGLWENHKFEDLAEHTAWFRNRELVLRFYAMRFNLYCDASPHAGHDAIAKLQEHFRVFNITQNIDDLLERSGSQEVIHLHGSINRKKCEWHQDINPEENNRFRCDYKTVAETAVEMGDMCPKCGGQMRPDVVWFGEAVRQSDTELDLLHRTRRKLADENGIFVCVGTSARVYPAAGFINFFEGASRKILIDPDPPALADFHCLRGTASEKLPELADRLIEEFGT